MLRAFLSHSSSDKGKYVRLVAERLSAQRIVFDELSFEEGMETYEQIHQGLNKSDLFVLFLSDAALNSKWVRDELDSAYELLREGRLEQFFPIVIEPNLPHNDARIPPWMQKQYNLRPITRPSVAARRIVEQLRRLSWELHPTLRDRSRLFVGRNGLIQQFEERVDSFEQPLPVGFIASGLKGIGRRTLLRHCFIKADIVPETYEPPTIILNETDSVEDFILRVYDLGVSPEREITDMMKTSLGDKLQFAKELLLDLQKVRDILFVIDDGCIVTNRGTLAHWFDQLVNAMRTADRIAIAIAARYRVSEAVHHQTTLFRLDVPELEPQERNGLLKRYSELRGLTLSREELRHFAGVLSGFPEQVFYAVDLVENLGVSKARGEMNLIVEYNTRRAVKVVEDYEHDRRSTDFLCFLAQFDFISYSFIFEIVGSDSFYPQLLERFLSSAICEYLGATKEYLRVSDTIRDYVLRNFRLNKMFEGRLKDHLEHFLANYAPEERDASDILYSLKAALVSHKAIDSKYLIPSHFLKSIKELYDLKKQNEEVIRLADRVLMNVDFMDPGVAQQVRYYLCLSLARTHDPRFLVEVEKIRGSERSFLYGFYHRLDGNYAKALKHLRAALKERPNFVLARNEIARVYVYLQDYERGLQVAKAGYEHSPTNPYFINTYFECLVRTERSERKQKVIERLLHEITQLKSPRAEEMFLTAQALYLAFYLDNEAAALRQADQAIEAAVGKGVPMGMLAKFAICERYRRLDDMHKILRQLKNQGRSAGFTATYARMKALTMAVEGDINGAIDFARMSLTKVYPKEAMDALIGRLTTRQ
jgi:hypothetical protein